MIEEYIVQIDLEMMMYTVNNIMLTFGEFMVDFMITEFAYDIPFIGGKTPFEILGNPAFLITIMTLFLVKKATPFL